MTGTVTAPPGFSLDRVEVRLVTRVEDGTRFALHEFGTVEADGSFVITDVPVGEYRVWFNDLSGLLVDTYLATTDPGTAPLTTVSSGQTVHVAATMSASPVMTVRVLMPAGFEGTGYYSRFVAIDEGGAERGTCCPSHAGEQFEYVGTGDGHRYRIEVVPDAAELLPVTVEVEGGRPLRAGERVDAVAQVEVGASISGEVTGLDGTPATGGSVSAVRWSDEGNWEPAKSTRVRDGRYSVVGLEAGSYRIEVSPGARPSQWVGGSETLEGAQTIEVAHGQAVVGADVTARPGSTVRGRLVVPVGHQMGSVSVCAHLVMPQGFGGCYRGRVRLDDSNLDFSFTGLPEGHYRFSVSDDSVLPGATGVNGFNVWSSTHPFTCGPDANTMYLARDDERSGVLLPVSLVGVQNPVYDYSGGSALVADGCDATPVDPPDVSTPETPRPQGPATIRKIAGPQVKGKAKVGRTLKATPGRWQLASGSTQVRVKYRWYVSKRGKDSAVRKGTARSLKLKKSMRGAKVRVRVTISAPGHRTRIQNSAWTKRVA